MFLYSKPGDKINYEVKPNRYAWLQVAKGIVSLNGESLRAGDGVQINTPETVEPKHRSWDRSSTV